MKTLKRFRFWLWAIVHRSHTEDDMDAELRFHIEARAEDLARTGVSREEALRRARMEFGGMEKTKEECREACGISLFESLLQDLRYALRMLRKSPGFTAVAVLTLALGIGANTAIFSVVDAVLLHPLPYKAPDRLVWFTESIPNVPDNNVSWLDMQDWKSQNNVFTGIAGYSDYKIAFGERDSGNPHLLAARFVSDGYFDIMGVDPLLGRTFDHKENSVGGPPVAVLSHSLWMDDFAGNPAAIGQTIERNNKSWTIVGVMPAGFGAITHTQIWLPFEQVVSKQNLTERQFSWGMYAVGRLKAGVTFEKARVNMSAISLRLEHQYPKTTGGIAIMVPLDRRIVGNIRPALLILSAAVLFLLLIACANIASLLLVKAAGRQKEIAVRLALGAGKWRVFRQLIVESLVLSLGGAILGLLLAVWGTKLVAALMPANSPFAKVISLNSSALLFTLALTLLTGLLFGLAPALMSLKMNLQSTLKSGTHQVHGGRNRAHRALVITEVGLAAALLIGAGLMMRSMVQLFRVAPGFDTHQLLTMDAILGRASILPRPQVALLFDQAVARIQQLPGVESVACASPAPFSDIALLPSWNLTFFAIKGRPPASGTPWVVHTVSVSPDYFRTLRVPLIAGRTFTPTDNDNSLPVAVIDQEIAQRYWPGQNPIGSQIKLAVRDFNDPSVKAVTIVGVVGTVKAGGLDAAFGDDIYQPQDQQPTGGATFLVRSSVAPLSLAHSVESAIHGAMPDSPVYHVQTMDEMVQASQATRSLSLRLLGAFSLGALLLAALGLYGVISYVVSQSTNEIGVRMALGAQRTNILGLVLGQGMRMALWGIGAGVVAALALTWLMTSLLFGVAAKDPLTFVGVTILLAIVTLLACYVPARRAMRVDPMVALRYE